MLLWFHVLPSEELMLLIALKSAAAASKVENTRNSHHLDDCLRIIFFVLCYCSIRRSHGWKRWVIRFRGELQLSMRGYGKPTCYVLPLARSMNSLIGQLLSDPLSNVTVGNDSSVPKEDAERHEIFSVCVQMRSNKIFVTFNSNSFIN